MQTPGWFLAACAGIRLQEIALPISCHGCGSIFLDDLSDRPAACLCGLYPAGSKELRVILVRIDRTSQGSWYRSQTSCCVED